MAERAALAEFLTTLAPEKWSAPTWCDKWNVQQVVGHLVAAAKVTAPHFLFGLIKSGFSFSRFVEGDLEKYAAGKPAEVLARFNEVVPSDRKPPGPAYVALGEVMVHGEDIRRALGSAGSHPEQHLRTLGDAYRKTGPPLKGKARSTGLRFEATDIEWTVGEGPVVSGPAMSLILAMVGRRAALGDCSGPGVAALRERGAGSGK